MEFVEECAVDDEGLGSEVDFESDGVGEGAVEDFGLGVGLEELILLVEVDLA